MTWLKTEEFLQHAPEAVGAQVAVNHTSCPSGIDRKQRLYVRRVARGVVAYCQHCGKKGAAFKRSGADVWDMLNTLPDESDSYRTRLELRKLEDAVRWVGWFEATNSWKTPCNVLDWLETKGFATTRDASVKYGAPEGEEPGLILPILGPDGRVVGVQVRRYFGALKQKGPKYETKLIEKTDPFVYGPRIGSVVLVEDYLSAVRLSESVAVVPLLGNSCPESVIRYLVGLGVFSNLYVWLDNDKPEIFESAYKICIQASPLFDSAEVFGDLREPTSYSDAELRTIVSDRILLRRTDGC